MMETVADSHAKRRALLNRKVKLRIPIGPTIVVGSIKEREGGETKECECSNQRHLEPYTVSSI